MIKQLINKFAEKEYRISYVFTGCGSDFLHNLLLAGGASSILEDATCLYSTKSLSSFIGQTPEKFVSHDVAAMMADASFNNHNPNEKHVAIAVTGSLIKTENERVDRINEAHISIRFASMEFCIHIVFNKDTFLENGMENYGIRRNQDAKITQIIIDTLINDLGKISYKDDDTVKNVDFAIVSNVFDYVVKTPVVSDKINVYGHKRLFSGYSTSIDKQKAENMLVFPGSFNPIHDGHIEMIETAKRMFNMEVMLELTTKHRFKGNIPHSIIANRVENISNRYRCPITVSDKTLFVDKIAPFAGAIMGFDTFIKFAADSIDSETGRIRDSVYCSPLRHKCIYVFARGFDEYDLFIDEFNKYARPFLEDGMNNFYPIFLNNKTSSTNLRKNANNI